MIGTTIKEARKKAGLSQEQLAARAGVSRQFVSSVERGANVSVRVLQKIAAALQLNDLELDGFALRRSHDSAPSRAAGTAEALAALQRAANSITDAERVLRQSVGGELRRDTLSPEIYPGLTREVVLDILRLVIPVLIVAPARGFELTSMALELAAKLDPHDAELLGRAWQEHARSLFELGRRREALEALNRAQELLTRGGAKPIHFADLDFQRGRYWRETDPNKAREAARRAAVAYAELGDRRKILNARLLEAAILYSAGRLREARDAWLELVEPLRERQDRLTLALVYSNIGQAYRQLNDLEQAEQYIRFGLELAGPNFADSLKARWSLALITADRGDLTGSIEALRAIESEFNQMKMSFDSGQVALDRVNLLLALGRTEEVLETCTELVERFVNAGATAEATEALSFIREAAANRSLTSKMISQAREALAAAGDSEARSTRIRNLAGSDPRSPSS